MASNSAMKSFEEQWSEVFDAAEATPSEQVWTNIDGVLANQEASKYRRGVVFYRWLAAASIVLATSLGFLLFFQNDTISTAETLSEQNDPASTVPDKKMESANPNTTTITADNTGQDDIDQNKEGNADTTGSDEQLTQNNAMIANLDEDEQRQNNPQEQSTLSTTAPMANNEWTEDILVVELLAMTSPLPTDMSSPETNIHMYNLPMALADISKPTPSSSQLWAGLGLSSGSFNPNVGNGTESLQANDAAFESDQERTLSNALSSGSEDYDPGISYAIAASAGWQFAPRWILTGGLQYQLSKSSTQTNRLIQNDLTEESFAPTSLGQVNSLTDASNLSVVNTDVNFNNNYQFLSIPIKIQYLILNQKFQLGVNTGLSTDIFLRNKVNESNNLVESFEQSSGDNSPYRRSFLSGILGVELGYNFLSNYYLTLEPSYRRSLNSFTRESATVNSNPSGLGLTIGFRYLFR